MAKECDCQIEEYGLPVLYPVAFDYCPVCGKRLQEVTIEEIKGRLRNIIDNV